MVNTEHLEEFPRGKWEDQEKNVDQSITVYEAVKAQLTQSREAQPWRRVQYNCEANMDAPIAEDCMDTVPPYTPIKAEYLD